MPTPCSPPREMGTPLCRSMCWCSPSKRGGSRGCLHPTFGCGPSGNLGWGAKTGTPSQEAGRGDRPHRWRQPGSHGHGSPLPAARAPGGGGRGLPSWAAPHTHTALLPGQELPAPHSAAAPLHKVTSGCSRTLHGTPSSWGHHRGDAVTFSRVAMPELRGGILTIPGYRVSVWANGISAGARGIAALCSAAQRGDSVARLAPVSHSAPSPGPTGGCCATAGTAGAGTPQQEGRCAAAGGTGQQVVRGAKAVSGVCGGVGRRWPGLRAGQGGSGRAGGCSAHLPLCVSVPGPGTVPPGAAAAAGGCFCAGEGF